MTLDDSTARDSIDRERLARTIALAVRSADGSARSGLTDGLSDSERAQIAEAILDRVAAIARAQASGQLPKGTLGLAHVCIDPYAPDRTIWHNYCDLFRALASGYAPLNIPKLGATLADDRAISSVFSSIWLPDWVCRKLRADAEAIERDAI